MHELHHHWDGIHWGSLSVETVAGAHRFRVPVYLGEIRPESVSVELYADPLPAGGPERHVLRPERPLSGAAGGYLYFQDTGRFEPAGDYTPRVVPAHPEAVVPLEAPFIRWYPS
jgi:starch phosphorylase